MPKDQIERKIEADIVSIGAGGAGLAAAITAAERGAKVILMEKRGWPGGNSAMAVGLLAADSHTQKRLSISASVDDLYKSAMDYFHYKVNGRIWRAWLEKSASSIKWLEDMGLRFELVPSFYPGQKFRTWHCINDSTMAGPAVIEAMKKRAVELGVQILTRCQAKKLLTNGDGSVTGVVADTKEGGLSVTAKGVILATGGYGMNKELLKKYHPNYDEDLHYAGYRYVTGDGHYMAGDVGADTDKPGSLMLCGHTYWMEKNQHVAAAAMQPYNLWVNKRGRRFVEEDISFICHEVGNALDLQPGKCLYAIFDQTHIDRCAEDGVLTLGLHETCCHAGCDLSGIKKELEEEAVEEKMCKISDSLDDIAEWIGAPGPVLKATVEEYNKFCRQGYDEIFGKPKRYLTGLESGPPYYCVKHGVGFLTTVGGIQINEKMEAVDREENPVPGLYAVGDTAGGWEEGTYNKRLSGSAFGFAINSGRIAGENAVARAFGK